MQALLARVEMLEHAHRQEQQRADDAEAELTRSRARPAGEAEHGDAVQQGFGHRIERVLRVAEQEAANARATASREAAALMERTRREAETHRQEVEQNLAGHREGARRRGRPAPRGRSTSASRGARRAGRRRPGGGRADARRGPDGRRADHPRRRGRVPRRRDDTESIIRRRHTEAENELQRLSGLHDGVRNDLGRLLKSLSGQLPGRQGGRHLAAANAEFQGGGPDDPQDQCVHAEHGTQPAGADAS